MNRQEKTFVVAVVGMCGSGKSVLTELFLKSGWSGVYFGGVTMDILDERKLPKTQKNEKKIREGLRAQYGMAAYAQILYPKIKGLAHSNNVVLDGLYSWAEYKFLKDNLGEQLIIVSIIANRSLRYERLECRPVRPLTPADAYLRDLNEIENLDKGGPIAIADYYIDNNQSLDDLTKQFHKFLIWLTRF